MKKLKKDNEDALLFDESNESGETGSESGSSTGSTGSGIAFRDFIGTGKTRDDFLSPEERKRLLHVHQDMHEVRVLKEKESRENRQEVREGKISVQDYRQGLSSSSSSNYQMHPELSTKAQFGVVDKQVTQLPTELESKTNEAEYQLKNEPQLRHTLQNVPRFNPKPSFNR